MEGQKELSIIIPLYNAIDTLDRCLANILSERRIEMEVILVNDSSTDDTLRLCEKYVSADERVSCVTRPNGGVAAARDTGFAAAKGEYITFVDQDDWVETDTYFVSVKRAQEQDADMVVFNYTKDTGSQVEHMVNRGGILPVTEDKDKLVEYAFFREEYRGFAAYVWNKIFKREFLLKNNISLESGLRRGDDIVFCSKVAACAPKTIYIDKEFYHYVQREDSITHTMTADNLERLEEILTGYDISMKWLYEMGVSERALDYMRCFYVFHASVLYGLAKQCGVEEKQRAYQKEMKRYFAQYKKQNAPYPSRIEQVAMMIDEEV
ncbi:MAG: glycosyltransferase [Lachnospiraceae bacterium]|nr:glycosyltransferase [Lachnospiraceae bacterium]